MTAQVTRVDNPPPTLQCEYLWEVDEVWFGILCANDWKNSTTPTIIMIRTAKGKCIAESRKRMRFATVEERDAQYQAIINYPETSIARLLAED